MLNIGILGCSEIAFRRFMPAVLELDDVKVIAIAEEYDITKLKTFCEEYDLEGMTSFKELIARDDIQAVYVPQPPALHYQWTKLALEHGKHVLVEKPSTTGLQYSKELVDIAKKKGLALHENYMFQYHSQIQSIKDLIDKGEVGDIRLIRANFGFPLRAQNDFRYNASLGGGALLDAGGYTAKLATILLGESIKVDVAKLNYESGYNVEMYGSATFSNSKGVVCQVGYGMDCYYQCNLEVWGSKGKLYTNRIFTAPPEYTPTVIVETATESKNVVLKSDSHFLHSIKVFVESIQDSTLREKGYKDILLQAKLVDDMRC